MFSCRFVCTPPPTRSTRLATPCRLVNTQWRSTRGYLDCPIRCLSKVRRQTIKHINIVFEITGQNGKEVRPGCCFDLRLFYKKTMFMELVSFLSLKHFILFISILFNVELQYELICFLVYHFISLYTITFVCVSFLWLWRRFNYVCVFTLNYINMNSNDMVGIV